MKRIFIILISLLLLVGCGKKIEEDYNERIDKAVSMVSVPVAKSNISEGDTINVSDIVTKVFDKEDIPSDVYTNVRLIIGKTAKVDINTGDYFSSDNVN